MRKQLLITTLAIAALLAIGSGGRALAVTYSCQAEGIKHQESRSAVWSVTQKNSTSFSGGVLTANKGAECYCYFTLNTAESGTEIISGGATGQFLEWTLSTPNGCMDACGCYGSCEDFEDFAVVYSNGAGQAAMIDVNLDNDNPGAGTCILH